MKKLLHLCFTSKEEVLCRCARDYEIMISRIGQAAFHNNTEILAYAVMSNHVHLVVQTADPSRFIKTVRSSYNQSFNYIYRRKGPLGERGVFKLELVGRQHIIDALTYVLQNPVHHKVTENPFDYPYSSMNLYYRNSQADNFQRVDSTPLSHRLVQRNVSLPDKVRYGESGIILPSSFLELQMVENLYGTYNAFQFLSHRKNYYEWAESQRKENKDAPKVNLHAIEPLMDNDTVNYIESSSYRWSKGKMMTDMELCSIIDNDLIHRYNKKSYTELTTSERNRIASKLLDKYKFKVSEEQVRRCLGV